jgi:hypothetical protein
MNDSVMGRACSRHKRDEKYIQNFGQKTDRKRSFGRSRNGWEKILKWILGKLGWKVCTTYTWLRTQGTVVGSCEYSNEPKKVKEILN